MYFIHVRCEAYLNDKKSISGKDGMSNAMLTKIIELVFVLGQVDKKLLIQLWHKKMSLIGRCEQQN